MARHISSAQVLEHIKTASFGGINNAQYPITSVTESEVVIGPYTFSVDKFDVGGMNPDSVQLVDSTDIFRAITLLDADGAIISHPKWATEDYDATKIRNKHLSQGSSEQYGIPLSLFIPKSAE